MILTRITGPPTQPISATEAAEWLRLDAPQIPVLESLIEAATQYLDGYTGCLGRALVSQTWDLKLDSFPTRMTYIPIPLPPLQSVTSIKYVDVDGVEQTWATTEYVVDLPGSKVHLGFEKVWPATRVVANAVTVRFVAGFTVATLPEADKLLILGQVAKWHEDREGMDRDLMTARRVWAI